MTDVSFYHFLMTQRQPSTDDPVAQFANNVFRDLSFPKHSQDYEDISAYLELNGHYLPEMSIFDQAFQRYQDHYHE